MQFLCSNNCCLILKVSKSGGDLTFSSSFTNDLDNDVDFMSALDKIETDYGNERRESASGEGNKNSKNKHERTKSTDKTSHRDYKNEQNKYTANIQADNQCTPARISRIKVDPKVPVGDHSTSNSFHDLSFASPMEISTPLIFKKKRLSSSGTRSSTSKKANLSASKKSVDRIKTSVSKIVRTSTPQVTPRRSLRSDSAKKGKNTMKKKRVLDGLDDPQVAEDSTDNVSNKSDFFKSLLVDNISLEESNIAKNNVGKKMKSPENEPDIGTKTDSNRNLNNIVKRTNSSATKCDDKENRKEENSENKDQDGEITMEDLPQIPTRGSNPNNTSTHNSVSLIEKAMEIKPGKCMLLLVFFFFQKIMHFFPQLLPVKGGISDDKTYVFFPQWRCMKFAIVCLFKCFVFFIFFEKEVSFIFISLKLLK